MALNPKFADLHCHPADMMYHRLRGKDKRDVITQDPRKYNPWNRKVIEKFMRQIKGKRAGKYLQSNPPKLISGQMKVVFASLYPIEHGFLGIAGRVHSFGNLLVRLPLLRDFLLWVNKALLNMTNERFSYLKGEDSRYFDELEAMYQFYVNATAKIQQKHVSIGDENRRDIIKVTGAYELCKNFADVQRIIQEEVPADEDVQATGKTAIVLTLEGMHAFGRGHMRAGKDVTPQLLEQRVRDWKLNKEYPLFFITFSHHFSNTLCGHAHSLPGVTRLLADQVPMMGKGFTPEGTKIINLLANMGNFSGNQAVGKRILIDVKHMSPAGRKEYYGYVAAHNAQHPHDKIPIIASHIGCCGKQKLEEVVGHGKAFLKQEKDKDSSRGFTIDGFRYDFNSWGINMTDEDIVEIVRSQGLLGLSMDQRVMASKKTNSKVNGFLGTRSKKKKYKLKSRIVLNHILQMAKAVAESTLTDGQKNNLWNCITLGSDYDGFIDPIDNYPTCNHYVNLQTDLLEAMQQYNADNPQGLLNTWTGREDQLINKICFDNAFHFLQSHF